MAKEACKRFGGEIAFRNDMSLKNNKFLKMI